MQAAGVVVAVEEGKEFVGGVLLAGEAAIAQHLGFEGADEGLGPGDVIGVGSGRHALLHACGAQPLAEGAAAILAATVTVEDDALGAASGGEVGVEGPDDHIAAQVIAQTPADDAVRAQVDDNGQVEPDLLNGDISDVTRRELVGLAGQRAALQKVVRGLVCAAVARLGHIDLGLGGDEPRFAH